MHLMTPLLLVSIIRVSLLQYSSLQWQNPLTPRSQKNYFLFLVALLRYCHSSNNPTSAEKVCISFFYLQVNEDYIFHLMLWICLLLLWEGYILLSDENITDVIYNKFRCTNQLSLGNVLFIFYYIFLRGCNIFVKHVSLSKYQFSM